MGTELDRAKKYCMRLLSMRPRSEKEFQEHLESTGYGADVRKQLIDLFKRNALIDDLKFAKEWIDSRLRSNPRGKEALREELRRKGISEKNIDEAFRDKIDELNERVIAAGLIKEKMCSIKASSKTDLKIKLFQYLLRRGFDPEIAEDIINDAVK